MSARKHLELLNFLCCCNKASCSHIKFSKSLVKAFREIAYNYLYTNLPLTNEEVRALQKFKSVLRKLANRELSIKSASKLLTFKVIRALLKPAVRLLNGDLHARTDLVAEESIRQRKIQASRTNEGDRNQ